MIVRGLRTLVALVVAGVTLHAVSRWGDVRAAIASKVVRPDSDVVSELANELVAFLAGPQARAVIKRQGMETLPALGRF